MALVSVSAGKQRRDFIDLRIDWMGQSQVNIKQVLQGCHQECTSVTTIVSA